MAFLQVKQNLADIYNICEAQNNLGLLSMAYQCKCNVDIHNGKISISNLTLRGPNIDSNYILVSKNSSGQVMWKRQALQEWMEKSPSEIYLSSFCNDQNYIKETEINYTISNYIEEFRDTIINNNLDIDAITISNITITDNFQFVSSNTEYPCILTNNGYGDNLFMTKIVQSISNNNSNTVCSASAVSNLYGMVKEIESQLPDEGSAYMISTNNLDDVGFNKVYAVSNLGLNESFLTKDLTLSNVYFSDSTLEENGSTYYLIRNNNTLDYKRLQYIQSYLETSEVNPPSATSVNNLYEFLNEGVNNRLITSNVLSEIISVDANGCNNPYLPVFQNRLGEAGIQTVAFTANWYDLVNAPRKLSGFSNVDFNDETLFIYSKCNLSDLENPTQAMINLGVSKVGRTGNFADLQLPVAISNIVSADSLLGAIPGVPFLIKTNNLSELQNVAEARHNLGMGDMATFSRNNVEILNGNITSCNLVVNSNMRYLHSNTDITLSGQNGNNVYLKCFTADGLGKWEDLPVANTTLSTQGIVYLTNDLNNSSSNVAITAFALSNVFFNNDNITDLVPLAGPTNFGIVKTTDNYVSPELSRNVVLDSFGISNMYNELHTEIDALSNQLTTGTTELIYSRMSNVTISNYNGNGFLQIDDQSYGDDIIKEISLNFPNSPNTYLASDGTFKEIKNISVSNQGSYNFLEMEDVSDVINGITVKQLTLNFPNTANQYLASDGTFQIVQPTTINQGGISLSNRIFFNGPIDILEFKPAINTIEFKNTLYTAGNGIEIDPVTRVIKNKGIVSAHDTFFVKTDDGSGTKISLTGALIGNTARKITGSPGQFLKCTNDDEYGFAALNQANFDLGTPGFVPAPIDANKVLLSDGWSTIADFQSGKLEEFDGVNQGLVPPLATGNKDEYFLNANGGWTLKSDITDSSSAIKEVRTNMNTILDVTTTTGIANINFKDGLNYQVITKSDDAIETYVWKGIIDVINNGASLVPDVNPNSQYLTASGDYGVPPSAKNFNVYMTFDDINNELKIQQNVNDINLPSGTTTCNVTLNYIHKYKDTLYENGGEFIRYANDGSKDGTNTSFGDINRNVINNASHSNRVFTLSATKRYMELFKEEFTEPAYNGSLDDHHLFTTKATSNYVQSRFDAYRQLGAFSGNVNYTTPDTVINYIDTRMFNNSMYNRLNNIFEDDTKFPTPLAVSNYVDFNYVKTTIKSTLSTNVNTEPNKVIIAETLSNYVNNTLTFDYNVNNFGGANHNKLVRASNVINYFNINRYHSGEPISFTDDIKFSTPAAVSNYVDTHYVKTTEKSTALTTVNIEPNKVIIAETLSNYVNNTLTFGYDENNFGGANHNKLVRASNVIHYFNENRHINHINFTNNTKFPTPLAVSNYVDNQFHSYTHTNSADFTDNTKFPTPLAVSNYVDTRKFSKSKYTTPNVFINDVDFTTPLATSNYINDRFNAYRQINYSVSDFANNTKFPTPAAVSNYVRQNYVNVGSRYTEHFPESGTDVFNGNQKIPTMNAIYGYINWIFSEDTKVENTVVSKLSEKTFYNSVYDNIPSSFDNDTKLTTPLAVSNYVNYKFNTQYTHTDENDFTNNTKFPTPLAVSNYVANLYVPESKILTSLDFDGYLVNDDTIPTTAGASNIANAILNTNIGDLNDQHTMEELETRSDYRDMLVTEAGLFGILNKSYERVNDGNYTYDVSKPNRAKIPTLGYMFESISNYMSNITKNKKVGNNYSQIETGNDIDDLYLPTIGFMNTEIDRVVEEKLTDGSIELQLDSLNIGTGISTSNITVEHLKVEQDIQFLYGERLDIIANEQFMTLDDQGFVQFLKVNTVAGLNNTTRAEDENSLITGLHNTTFDSNQFLCGQYNTIRNIYQTIDYTVGETNTVNLAVGTGSDDANRKNGLEVHNTGEVYVNSNLILGNTWRISFDSDQLVIEKFNSSTYVYEQKHIFK